MCHDVSHSVERDRLIIDIMSIAIESSHEFIPMSSRKVSRNPVGSVESSIPGWKDIVDPYMTDAKCWFSVWQSAERPNKGVLFEIMKKNSESVSLLY